MSKVKKNVKRQFVWFQTAQILNADLSSNTNPRKAQLYAKLSLQLTNNYKDMRCKVICHIM